MKAALSNTWVRLVLCWVLAIALGRFFDFFDRFSSGWRLTIMSVLMLVLTVSVVVGIIRSEKRREQR